MKSLITGGTGFVGRHLERYLQENQKVVVSSRSKNFKNVVKLDLLDVASSRQVFKRHRFDRIFHLTSQSSVKLSLHKPFETIYDNINTTVNLLHLVHELGLKANIVLASTSEIYKPARSPLTETSPLEPSNPYAISKILTDYLVRNIVKDFKMNVTLLRLFNHTGPGQTDNFVLASFSKQMAEIKLGMRKPVLEVGNLGSYRDFVDVRDVCRAYALVSETGGAGEAYNVCSGKAYKIESLLRKLIRLSGLKVQIKVVRSRVRKIEVPRIVGDYSKIKKAFGWEPEIPIEQTLRDMYEWWLESLQN